MIFPESKRVIYQKNPLEQVICQLRFPPILRIESELPAGFQEKIRISYPLYQQKPDSSVVLPDEILQHLSPEMTNAIFGATSRSYDFASEDQNWTVNLTKDFIALTNRKYKRWEQFREKLEIVIDAFISEYSPAFFSRIGLRYRNVIKRSDLNIEKANWGELLKPYIAGELASPELKIRKSIVGTLHNVLLNLEDELGQVKVVHGLVQDNKNEDCYLIDSDFFTEKRTDVNHGFKTLIEFNRENHRLFRWCITNRLNDAMEPNDT